MDPNVKKMITCHLGPISCLGANEISHSESRLLDVNVEQFCLIPHSTKFLVDFINYPYSVWYMHVYV